MRREFKTSNADIVIYGSDTGTHLDLSIDGLKKVSELKGAVSPAIGFSDLSPIAGGFPNGGVFVSSEYVVCNAVGMDINCGFSFSELDLNAKTVYKKRPKETAIRNLFETIEGTIPIGNNRSRDRFRDLDIQSILNEGIKALPESYIREEDREKIEYSGSLEGIFNINHDLERMARRQLSSVGGGNHFIDFMILSETYNQSVADQLKLNPRKAYLLLHTGSKGMGFEVNSHFNDLFRENPEGISIGALSLMPAKSKLSEDYLKAVNAASNFAYSSRAIIRKKIDESIAETKGADTKSRLILDSGHNMIEVTEAGVLHRKGAQRVLDNKGELKPFILPGSMNSPAYLMMPTEKISETHGTVNHGSGRIVRRKDASDNHSDYKFKNAIKDVVLSIKKFRQGREEAPYNYKNIEDTVDELENEGLATRVAKFQPFAVMIRGK